MRKSMAKNVHQKVEAILRDQYPVQNLATDVDLPEIIRQLRARQIDLETSQNKYHDFFNFAPVGCLTLDEKGLIVDINLTDAEMLRQKPEMVPNKLLRLHLEVVFTSGRHGSIATQL